MQSRACAAPGCSTPAALRQLEPVDPDFPRQLCVRHWSELRILHPDRASLYGSIKVLGPLMEDDPGESLPGP